ncbi:hypothetical protein [Leptolyngbya sp. KIOST-1]|uniref:hypothetical protein n=1 Tax=Leptolyngbya sp. KIOST-1 TaxID=1229172 RepID=UPI0012E023BB|nr:hypothetical protein [Leptolyngbya sp. KIOST-1]
MVCNSLKAGVRATNWPIPWPKLRWEVAIVDRVQRQFCLPSDRFSDGDYPGPRAS